MFPSLKTSGTHVIKMTFFKSLRCKLAQKDIMFKLKLLPLAMRALSPVAFEATPTGTGGLVQQIAPALEVKPAGQSVATPQDRAKIAVNHLQVTGAQIYPEAQLLAVTGFAAGSRLSLTALQAMARCR
ncbi:hypothetical protein [Rhodoferax sp.]|uniref:hypothetical protein n=1 Tax=Rhodoferax sp. TaxID=50421 RepID=UPI0025F618D6|nr:hypothetical protein [Rhodoferax sp.]